MSKLAKLNDDKQTEEEGPEEGLDAVDEQLEAPVHKPEGDDIHNDERH